MNGDLIKHIQPLIVAIAFLLLYLAEHLRPQVQQGRIGRHDFINIAIGIFNAVFTFVAGFYFQRFLEWLSIQHIGFFNLVAFPATIHIILEFVIIDLFMYWWHRVNHQWSFLWIFHRFHHVDEAMNSTTALRFHIGELSLSYLARLLIFPLFGISIAGFLCYTIIFFPIVLLHHSNISITEKLDLLMRRIIVTPRMHRIHHSRVRAETDSNFSSVLPFWDRLFRTYNRAPQAPIIFGLED